MKIELTSQQKSNQAKFRVFVEREIVPYADQYDSEERIPVEFIRTLARHKLFGSSLPLASGGQGLDMITYGLLHEEIGRGCSSVRSLLTAHDMVAHTLQRWGSKAQKSFWLPKLAAGQVIAAFGLSEPNIGSDAKRIETRATLSGDVYILDGCKKWITGGQIADVFLVFAQSEGSLSAFLVERDVPGLSLKPISGMLGVRASMLAELELKHCRVPRENLIGREGFGFSHVAVTALDWGRFCVAWGCIGIAQACLEACLQYTSQRKQFGVYLKEHPLICQMMTEMITRIKAARLLCYQAAYLKDTGDPNAIMETAMAKYFASLTATHVANDAVQIHGANGCSSAYAVQRYFRDAKIMEIIEGSTQIQQLTIAQYGYQEYGMSLGQPLNPEPR